MDRPGHLKDTGDEIRGKVLLVVGPLKDAEEKGSAWFESWSRKYTLSKAFQNRDKSKNACKWDLEIEA